ncbi:MAG: hypothetical protein KME12_20760 [Trichocoleus desertorum ATA4-8-CV12]|jgi:hypothetical protein|nr:hypothetical protein [Trichocoleus desertorum ATA4-8-CV12]
MNSKKQKGKNQSKKTKQGNYSTIAQHKAQGKNLLPPLAEVPNTKFISWLSERLPEMLWVTLLITHLPREHALEIFRKIADYIFKLPEEEKFSNITHSGLAKLSPNRLEHFLEFFMSDPTCKKALSPLLLLKTLPAYDHWAEFLSNGEAQPSWEALMDAVANTLDHQSQAATDCRWVRVLCMMTAGKLRFPASLEETAKGIAYYPEYGDLAQVRPSIRSSEGALSSLDVVANTDWPQEFWKHCLSETPCFPINFSKAHENLVVGTSRERLQQVRELLIEHCYSTTDTSAVDARHDTLFGLAFYCLDLMEELLRIGNSQSIMGRTALRTIVECYITLAYLVHKNDVELWKAYRVFGAGQAKLTFLKLNEAELQPSYVDIEALEHLANEDMWQEFLPINIGHWEKTNLRQMSEVAGVKDIYDRFYSWTSTFLHGHWGAVRNTVFDTCGNPLHRLHRIPRTSSQLLPDVIPDGCELIDKILGLVSVVYPEFSCQISISYDQTVGYLSN